MPGLGSNGSRLVVLRFGRLICLGPLIQSQLVVPRFVVFRFGCMVSRYCA